MLPTLLIFNRNHSPSQRNQKEKTFIRCLVITLQPCWARPHLDWMCDPAHPTTQVLRGSTLWLTALETKRERRKNKRKTSTPANCINHFYMTTHAQKRIIHIPGTNKGPYSTTNGPLTYAYTSIYGKHKLVMMQPQYWPKLVRPLSEMHQSLILSLLLWEVCCFWRN